jgi:hypothetical protein
MAERDKHVTEATTFRLDTVDLAIEVDWQVESFNRIDEFSKDGVTVMVQYAADDEIESLTRSLEGRPDEFYDADSSGKAERLRIWLGVQSVSSPSPIPGEDNTSGVPVTVERLRARGMSLGAYVRNDGELQILDLITNDAVATAREYIRSYDGRTRVMWERDGSVSEPDDEIWWAEMPLPDGRVVGGFKVNRNFHAQ